MKKPKKEKQTATPQTVWFDYPARLLIEVNTAPKELPTIRFWGTAPDWHQGTAPASKFANIRPSQAQAEFSPSWTKKPRTGRG